MFGETVTRVRRGALSGVDRYDQPTYAADVETALEGAAFDPGGSEEPREVGRTAVVTSPRLYFRNVAVDVLATDRVRVRGVLYDVKGDPAVWVSPYEGATRGTVVELKVVTG